MWACMFFGLLFLNIGFVLGCFFGSLKITSRAEKKAEKSERTEHTLSQKEKNYISDLKFLMDFDGNEKKDEVN